MGRFAIEFYSFHCIVDLTPLTPSFLCRITVNLKLQKRLAASVLKCGKRKIWLDPNEINEIALANSRRNVVKLYKDGMIMKKPEVVHSRARVQVRNEAKRKGRHTGTFSFVALPFCVCARHVDGTHKPRWIKTAALIPSQDKAPTMKARVNRVLLAIEKLSGQTTGGPDSTHRAAVSRHGVLFVSRDHSLTVNFAHSQVLVSAEVLPTHVCPRRCYGCAVHACSVVCSRR